MSEFLPEVIKGNFNQDAIKTLLAVKEAPGVNNPLYIYGPPGTGKSFTVQAFLSYFPESMYIKAGKIKPESLKELTKYKILVIDDFHLIQTDINIQSIVIEVIDEYVENKKQIILIADKPVEELPFHEGLRSRIEGGISIEFRPLDEISKKRIIDIMGEKIPQELRSSLYDKPFKDIRKIEGEIKKLLILGKPGEHRIQEKKPGEDFNGFIHALRNEVPENLGKITKTSEEERLREEYRDKMYVWQMKGFNVDKLKEAIDNGTIEDITGAFVSFTTNVQRLVELHRRYGMLDRRYFPESAEEIEEKLFDPDSFMYLEEKISLLEHKVALKRDFSKNLIFDKTLEKLIVSDANKEVYNLLNSILSSPFKGDNPIIIVGGRGTGKTHLLNAFAQELTKRFPHLLVAYLPFHLFLAEGKAIKRKFADADILFIDDFHHTVEKGYVEDITFIITKLLKTNKRIIISTTKSPKFLRLLDETKELIAKGRSVYLNPPDRKIKIAMAEKIIQDMEFEGKEIDINALADKVEGGYYDIDAYIFSFIEKYKKEKGLEKPPEREIKKERAEEILPKKEEVKFEEIISTKKKEIKQKRQPTEKLYPSEQEVQKEEEEIYEGIDMKLDDFKERLIEEI